MRVCVGPQAVIGGSMSDILSTFGSSCAALTETHSTFLHCKQEVIIEALLLMLVPADTSQLNSHG